MPCERFDLPGGGTAIVCTRGRRRAAPCFYCPRPHERLCDHEVAPGKTCSRKLCEQHARRVGEDRDLCPDHAAQADRPATPPGRLMVCTGNVNQHRSDPEAFDVTILSGGPAGAPFAPSVSIWKPAMEARKAADRLRLEAEAAKTRDPAASGALLAEAERIEAESWATYRRAFLAEMLVSSCAPIPAGWEHDVQQARARGRTEQPEAWAALDRRARVVLLCYCRTRERCHRGLLAQILIRRGAADGGELAAPSAVNQLGLFGGG